MENIEMSLKENQRTNNFYPKCSDFSSQDKKDQSKIYIKHLKNIKNGAGLSILVNHKKKRVVSSNVLHSRINQDFEKLYDMSPSRKKQKLQNARFCIMKSNISEIPKNSESCFDCFEKMNSLIEQNYNNDRKYRKSNQHFQALLPKIKSLL